MRAVETMRDIYQERIPRWRAAGYQGVLEWDDAWRRLANLLERSVGDFKQFCAQVWNLFAESPTLRRAVAAVVAAWERLLEVRREHRERERIHYGFR